MAIGNPINLTSNVESKNISVIATAGQTQFTVTGGYRINQISVFRNGVRLVDGRDFTALDGSIVTLLSAALVGDALEFQIFDDFRVADALSVNSGGTVNGNVTVTGILSTTNLSIGSSISLDATTGIITAVQVIGGTITGTATTAINAQGLIGTPDITVNNIVAAAGTFSGVLTYEDVTNIDSLGIVTARTGVDITANGLVVNAGVSTFAANLSIADKIIHTGDSNTAIRFPSPDTFAIETTGIQRFEVNSTGDVGLVGIATATGLVVVAGSGIYAGHTGVITATSFVGALTGAVTGNADTATTATTSTNVTVADESSDTTCFPLFATAATGNLPPKSGTNLTFNSSTGALTATSFVGALTGNVTGNISGGTVAGSTGTFTSEINADGNGASLVINRTIGGSANIIKVQNSGSDVFRVENDGSATFASDVNIADKIIHTGDTNTAIRFPAADTFTVETGGSEAARFDSNQRLLLGDTSARTVGTIDGLLAKIAIETPNNIGAGLNIVWNRSQDAYGPRIRLGKSRTATVGGSTIVQNGDELGTIQFCGADGTDLTNLGAKIQCKVDGTPGGNDMPGRLMFFTSADGSGAPTERLRITSDGKLLVGSIVENGSEGISDKGLVVTSDGENTLKLLDSTSYATNVGASILLGGNYRSSGDTQPFVRLKSFKENSTDNNFDYGFSISTNANGGSITERLRITSGGNMGLGTNNPSSDGGTTFEIYNADTPTLKLNDGGQYKALFQLRGNDLEVRGSNGNMEFYTGNADGASSTERLRIKSDGNVGINETTPQQQLHVHDDTAYNGIFINGNGAPRITFARDTTTTVEWGVGVDGTDGSKFCIAQAGNTAKITLDTSGNFTAVGNVSDSIGPLRRLGVNAQSTTGTYTFVVGDAGRIVRSSGSTAALHLDQNIFTAGDMISVFNVSSGNNTIVSGTGVTLYNTADAATGTRTIAAKGMVTIVCTATNEFAISGSQLT